MQCVKCDYKTHVLYCKEEDLFIKGVWKKAHVVTRRRQCLRPCCRHRYNTVEVAENHVRDEQDKSKTTLEN